MSNSGDGISARRLTSRGAATKTRIVEAANQLMFERGVALTTLADVRTASATSKSQLYQHFADKNALVVMSRQVVFDSADGRGSDRGVVPVMIVEVQPARECFAALSL